MGGTVHLLDLHRVGGGDRKAEWQAAEQGWGLGSGSSCTGADAGPGTAVEFGASYLLSLLE